MDMLFECHSGVSGDMTLGALADLADELGRSFGPNLEAIAEGLSSLPVDGFRLSREDVKQAGVTGTRVIVEVDEAKDVHRHWSAVRDIIVAAKLPKRVEERALAAFEKIAVAEGKVHGVDPEKIHFHEVGCMDAIIDVAGSMLALELLGVERVWCSVLNVGHGTVECRHGVMPVPAPATAEILRGLPWYQDELSGELVTPTGAAIVSTIAEDFGPAPAFASEAVGYGAGTREHEKRPNYLRITAGTFYRPQRDGNTPNDFGDMNDEDEFDLDGLDDEQLRVLQESGILEGFENLSDEEREEAIETVENLLACSDEELGRELDLGALLGEIDGGGPIAGLEGLNIERLLLVTTEMDDMNGEMFTEIFDRLFKLGALDVNTTPIQMKKNRPAISLRVLVDEESAEPVIGVLMRESSTFGVKVTEVDRYSLDREMDSVETPYGEIAVKVGYWDGEIVKVKAEFDSAQARAHEAGVALSLVYRALDEAIARKFFGMGE